MTINGWGLFYFRLFKARLDQLEFEVTALARKDPQGFVHHPKAKLLKAVLDNVRQHVPQNPDLPAYRLGKTLGETHTHWRRVKKQGLPPRYRLFFRFTSQEQKIVYVWLNDEKTLRKDGARSDVYAVFKGMLSRGDIPVTLDDLLRNSAAMP